jgi:hypothetical protein
MKKKHSSSLLHLNVEHQSVGAKQKIMILRSTVPMGGGHSGFGFVTLHCVVKAVVL